ncbi:hypothetical protein K458DRAFT_298990 [Lentithecium fluviatile CBS 122367]|uniref:Uncharacterized protein n=1 Tax=Lentithecium fluviatile CBS 122367 TaxID=1168545 RepID=A0A6G1J7M1_9PLEO|nr:hypothetical protein K458DRAFT_298990 [Lentithecium fluviatile CBS 122367]
MRSFSFIVALLFAFVAVSHAFPNFQLLESRKGRGNGTSKGNSTTQGNSVNRACKQMAKLTKLTELAANQTKLDAMVAKGKLNDTEVAEIKSKAADATTQLQTMQSNTTLVTECAVVDAHQKDVSQCKRMKKLTKLAAMANNQTAMDAFVAKKELNSTQVTKLQEKIANATTKLQEMSSNTTLTDLCTQIQEQKGASGTESSDSSSSTTGSTGAATTPETSTGGATGLTLQALPYVFLPAVASIFAFLL